MAQLSSDPRLDVFVGKGSGNSSDKGNNTEKSAAPSVPYSQAMRAVVMGMFALWFGLALTS